MHDLEQFQGGFAAFFADQLNAMQGSGSALSVENSKPAWQSGESEEYRAQHSSCHHQLDIIRITKELQPMRRSELKEALGGNIGTMYRNAMLQLIEDGVLVIKGAKEGGWFNHEATLEIAPLEKAPKKKRECCE